MQKKNTNNAPPIIRVFLSSTFADMDYERSYYNEVLVPKLNRICSNRGVSFFSVDLRWGITREDQMDGKVLPICLDEIDKCRPYFIGILGNRYGSIMERVPEQIAGAIPWLAGKEGKSITELEMLYAVLDHSKNDTSGNSTFYFRSEELSEKLYGTLAPENQAASEQLKILKNCIMQTENVGHANYGSIEEFGEHVLKDLVHWLDTNFPEGKDVSKIRREWYDSELLRNYIPNPKMHSFLDSYLTESQKSLLLYGDGARGKTTFLTAWQPQKGHKILINCGSDERFGYWPSVAKEIIVSLCDLDKSLSLPDITPGMSAFYQLMNSAKNATAKTIENKRLSTDFYFVSDKEREQFRSVFLNWIRNLELKEDVTIVINDLNLLDDETRHLLSWLPSSCCEHLHLICSSNEEEMLENAEILGWNLKEFPLFCKDHANKFIIDFLRVYGKNLSENQMNLLLNSISANYPGQLRFIISFLMNHGRFDNLDLLITELSKSENIPSIYQYVYHFLIEKCTAKEMDIIRTVFGLLRCADLALSEQECYALSQKDEKHTAIEWARCCRIFEQFELIKGDYWYIRNEETLKFADLLLSSDELETIHTILGDYMMERLLADSSNKNQLHALREHVAFAKEALLHYQKAGNWQKLFDALQNDLILYPLSKVDWYFVRVSWMKLFLYSEFDISVPLLDLIQKYGTDYGSDNKLVASSLAGLFPDLELRQYSDRVHQIVGLHGACNSLGENFDEGFTKDFIPLYKKMHTLKSGRNYRRLYDYVCKLLPYQSAFNTAEKCNLLFFKADSEDQLSLYREELDTTNEYYRESLHAGMIYEMNRALSMRGNALFRLSMNRESLQINRRLCQIFLSNGDLRGYLSALNIIAMCQYRLENYEESLKIFDRLIYYWEKISNPFERGTILMNKCNALFLSGDVQKAYDCAEEFYHQIKNNSSLTTLAVKSLGNLGYYALQMKKYEVAERYLLKTIQEAKQYELEGSLLNAYNGLISLYSACDRFMDEVDIYEEELEFLWMRQAYPELIKKLKSVMNLLMDNHYAPRAKKLKKQWREKFSSIENGLQYFEENLSENGVDTIKSENLREQIALAKSEQDTVKTAQLYAELAHLTGSSDPLHAITYYLESAMLYETAGLTKEQTNSIIYAITCIFKNGKILDESVFKNIMESITDSSIIKICDMWKTLGEKNPDMEIDEKFSNQLRELIPLIDSLETLVTACLSDLSEQIVHSCSAEELLEITQKLPENSKEWISVRFRESMCKDFSQKLQGIIEDYLSPFALKVITFYEKCIQYMMVYPSDNLASTAGNLALIFRRRKDKEKTYRYHTISLEAYQKAGQFHDYLIEMMNLSTAYFTFQEEQKALDLLRKALKETENTNESRMRASIAGNIASFLTRYDKEGSKEEILECFSIEESSFRACKSYRDLAISLINQLIFMIDTEDPEKWKHKLEEAGQIIRSNELKEFSSVLSKLEWKASQILYKPTQTKTGNPKEKIEQLIAQSPFSLKSIEAEDDLFHAVCLPKEKNVTGAEQLHLFYNPDSPNKVIAVGVFQPALHTENAAENVKKYIDWWNTHDDYQLSLEEEKLLRFEKLIVAKNFSELTQSFLDFLQLWDMDKTNALVLFIGLNDLSFCQGAKLRAMQKEEN